MKRMLIETLKREIEILRRNMRYQHETLSTSWDMEDDVEQAWEDGKAHTADEMWATFEEHYHDIMQAIDDLEKDVEKSQPPIKVIGMERLL